MSGLLEWVESPQRLKNLTPEQLQPLADELRQSLLESVSRSGGHLSANLGTVELPWLCTMCSTRQKTG